MFGWLKEFLDLKIEYKRKKLELVKTKDEVQIEHDICQSCETLKMQLAIANQEKKDLLSRILREPEVKTQTVVQNPRAVLPSRHLGFDTKRRALEAESRHNARLIEEKQRENVLLKEVQLDPNLKIVTNDVSDLEAELDLAAAERESQTGVK